MTKFWSDSYNTSLKTAFSIIIPWKNNHDVNASYRKGWNDCVRKIRKNRTKLLKELEKCIPTE